MILQAIEKPTYAVDCWDADERQAWRPLESLLPSEWAERYRVLKPGQTNRPGLWRNDNAPYLRGVMDFAVKPGVVQINIMKAGQIGVSEALRNLICYWAVREPDPIGLGLPNKALGRKIVNKRITPLLEEKPLSELRTARAWDVTKEQIQLANGFNLMLMWAGSAASTSADPMRRVINDEVDKFEAWGGGEPDPVGRTWTRLRSYGDRKLQINVSTPTSRFGQIFRKWEQSSIHLEFHVPCSICGVYQKLVFAQLKYDRHEKESRQSAANRVMRDKSVWYECVHCKQKIHEDEKTEIVRQGRWVSEDGKIQDAESVEKFPRGTTLGLHVSALVCLWESWSGIMSQFLKTENNYEAFYNFQTETLGVPMEEQAQKTSRSLYEKKSKDAKLAEGIVPLWGIKLLATIDTQHDHFWCVLRAWGSGMKSQRVWHGRVETFQELDDICFRRPWAVEGSGRQPMTPELILIDSGGTQLEGDEASRTMQVYHWAIQRRARVRAIKGAPRNRRGMFIYPGQGIMRNRNDSRKHTPKLTIWFVDGHHFYDVLASYVIQGTTPDDKRDEIWFLNQHNDDEYNQQLSGVHKIIVRTGGKLEERWVPRERGWRIDLADCECYQVAAAYMANVHNLPSEKELAIYQATVQAEAKREKQETVEGRVVHHDPWAIRPL